MSTSQDSNLKKLKQQLEISLAQVELVMNRECAVERRLKCPTVFQDAVSALQLCEQSLPELDPSFKRIFAHHDGEVHNPLGAGSYIYKSDYIPSLIRYLGLPTDFKGISIPPSATDLIVHIGAQPNNSPHAGTMVVFALAFLIARKIKEYFDRIRNSMNDLSDKMKAWLDDFSVLVHLDLVDTAPDNNACVVRDGIVYQRSHRMTQAGLTAFSADYESLMKSAKEFTGGIAFKTTNQQTLTSMSCIPGIIATIVAERKRLGAELAPERGCLGLRSACPHCGYADKHGVRNEYSILPSGDVVIDFFCFDHGRHSITTSNPSDVAKLEFNTPLRNLVRALAYGIDTRDSQELAHATCLVPKGAPIRQRLHLRVTGADYTGMYSEQLLWRQLTLLSSSSTGLGSMPPPVIAYAPLIQDWAGSKLSKSLYVKDGAYKYLNEDGKGYLLSYSGMLASKKDPTVLFEEVERWIEDPRKLFRPYSIDYIHRVFQKKRENMEENQ